MDSNNKLSAAEDAALTTLGDKIMALVSLMGPGWLIQIGKDIQVTPTLNPNGWVKLMELPTVGGATQFLDNFWNYEVHPTEEAARAAHPELPEGCIFWKPDVGCIF